MSAGIARTRLFFACGVLLAGIFLVLELGDRGEFAADSEFGVVDISSDLQQIRILMRQCGPSPWHIQAAKPFLIQSSSNQSFTGKECVVQASSRGFLINDQLFGPVVTMTTPHAFSLGGLRLKGQVRFDNAVKSKRPILKVDIEQYLAQVLPGEMPLAYPDTALESQVIASRSYALARMKSRRSRRWDLTDGETSQMFQSLNRNTEKSRVIVERTRGIVLEYDGQILPAYFSANCGGKTRGNHEAFGAALLQPLRGITCHHCSWSKDYSWIAQVKASDFRRHSKLGGGSIKSMSIQAGTGSGYTNKIQCLTSEGSKMIRPKVLRRRFGNRKFKSDWVTGIEFDQNQVRIGGRGFGHGVGLCQNGACGMARLGHSASEILSFYFPDANLARLRESSKL